MRRAPTESGVGRLAGPTCDMHPPHDQLLPKNDVASSDGVSFRLACGACFMSSASWSMAASWCGRCDGERPWGRIPYRIEVKSRSPVRQAGVNGTVVRCSVDGANPDGARVEPQPRRTLRVRESSQLVVKCVTGSPTISHRRGRNPGERDGIVESSWFGSPRCPGVVTRPSWCSGEPGGPGRRAGRYCGAVAETVGIGGESDRPGDADDVDLPLEVDVVCGGT